MDVGAGELDEAFVEIAIGAVFIGEPEVFEHFVGFVELLGIKAVEIAQIMGVVVASLEGFDQFGNAVAFVTHIAG
jgi:hypothetical protein